MNNGASYPILLILVLLLIGTQNITAQEPLQLTLKEAIALAVSNSEEVRQKQYQLQASDIQYKLSLFQYLPSFSFSLSDYSSIKYMGQDSNNSSLQFKLSQPIYRGGRLRNSRRLSQVEVLRLNEELENILNQLQVSCYTSYLTYIIQQKKIANQQEILSISRDQVEIARKEFELGRIREIDLLEVEYKLQAMIRSLEEQKLNLNQAAYAFKKLIGINLDAEFEVMDEFPENYSGIDFIPEIKTLTEMAVSSNKQMFAKLLALERFDLEHRSVKGQWLPNLTVDAAVSLTGNGYPLQKAHYSITFKMDLPLPWVPISSAVSIRDSPHNEYGNSRNHSAQGPSSFGYFVNLRLAELNLENAQEEYMNLKKSIVYEVRFSLERYESLKKSLVMSRKQVEIQKKRLGILSKEVDLGTATRLEYVTAQAEYMEQIMALLEGSLELLVSERSLEQLLGLKFNQITDIGVVL